jgi:hypothetical protein
MLKHLVIIWALFISCQAFSNELNMFSNQVQHDEIVLIINVKGIYFEDSNYFLWGLNEEDTVVYLLPRNSINSELITQVEGMVLLNPNFINHYFLISLDTNVQSVFNSKSGELIEVYSILEIEHIGLIDEIENYESEDELEKIEIPISFGKIDYLDLAKDLCVCTDSVAKKLSVELNEIIVLAQGDMEFFEHLFKDYLEQKPEIAKQEANFFFSIQPDLENCVRELQNQRSIETDHYTNNEFLERVIIPIYDNLFDDCEFTSSLLKLALFKN